LSKSDETTIGDGLPEISLYCRIDANIHLSDTIMPDFDQQSITHTSQSPAKNPILQES
jgi:hypothetical protein